MTGSFDHHQIHELTKELENAGATRVVGTIVNATGLTHAKSAPIGRLAHFHRAGLGAAPVWDVFCVDAGIAATEGISAVGDLRLRIDLDAVRRVGSQAWAPANMVDQDGSPHPGCTRTALRSVAARWEEAGLDVLVGHELELVLVRPDGSALDGSGWVPYGLGGLLDHEAFLTDLHAALAEVGVVPEQVHAEYGAEQFELSLPPQPPVAAADAVVLTKLVIGRVARAHGMLPSFSPVPFAGSVGNGAHQHMSFTRDGSPLLAGGDGPHGLTPEGASAIGGLVAGLADVQGLLGGSILSAARLAPGGWSGAFCGWGHCRQLWQPPRSERGGQDRRSFGMRVRRVRGIARVGPGRDRRRREIAPRDRCRSQPARRAGSRRHRRVHPGERRRHGHRHP